MSAGEHEPGEELEFGESLAQPSLAVGFLACVPLFVLYEVGLWAGGPGTGRSSAELLLGLPLSPLGGDARWVRWGLIVALAVIARTVLRKRHIGPARAVGRNVAEGLAGALALGPVLILLSLAFDESLRWRTSYLLVVAGFPCPGMGSQGPWTTTATSCFRVHTQDALPIGDKNVTSFWSYSKRGQVVANPPCRNILIPVRRPRVGERRIKQSVVFHIRNDERV